MKEINSIIKEYKPQEQLTHWDMVMHICIIALVFYQFSTSMFTVLQIN